MSPSALKGENDSHTRWTNLWGAGHRGWTESQDLIEGDQLLSHDGRRVVVGSVEDAGETAEVYNLRVTQDHTYFVGSREWGFSAWAHNNCGDERHQGFSNLDLGTLAHQKFQQELVDQTNTLPEEWLMRTAPGLTGVDAEYIGPPDRYPGYDYAELKPATDWSLKQFQDQVDNWGLPNPVRLWFYDEDLNQRDTEFDWP